MLKGILRNLTPRAKSSQQGSADGPDAYLVAISILGRASRGPEYGPRSIPMCTFLPLPSPPASTRYRASRGRRSGWPLSVCSSRSTIW